MYLESAFMIIEIPIIYEHQDWILCYKPAGLDFHDDQDVLGFMSVLKRQLDRPDLLPVHRLDKPTSGLILVAKNQTSCAQLCEAFAARHVEKYYLAVCPKTLKKKQGAIIGDMDKSRRGTFKLLKTRLNPAVTQFLSFSIGEGRRVCLLKPKTGKTHQLRVAMKSLSGAIEGDKAYGGSSLDRLYLHAYSISFEFEGQRYQFVEPPREGELFTSEPFLKLMPEISQPWSLEWPKL